MGHLLWLAGILFASWSTCIPDMTPSFLRPIIERVDMWQIESLENGTVRLSSQARNPLSLPFVTREVEDDLRMVVRLDEAAEVHLSLHFRDEDRYWSTTLLVARSDDPAAFIAWILRPDGSKSDYAIFFPDGAPEFEVHMHRAADHAVMLINGRQVVRYTSAWPFHVSIRPIRGSVQIDVPSTTVK